MTAVLSQDEILAAREALGLHDGPQATDNGALAHWRNVEWNSLVARGMAEARPGVFDFECLYMLTREGAEAVLGHGETIRDDVKFVAGRGDIAAMFVARPG